MNIEIWSDVVCPWCYIGKRRLEVALERFEHRDEVEITYRSFVLYPTMAKGESREVVEVLAERGNKLPDDVREYLGSVEQKAADSGVEVNLIQGRTGNTIDAHRLLQLAEEKGLAGPAWDRFYRAHFTEGRSLFDDDTLIELITEVGVDEADARAVLGSNRYNGDVLSDHKQATDLGSNSVPLFVVDRKAGVAGAHSPEAFLEFLDKVWADTHPVTV